MAWWCFARVGWVLGAVVLLLNSRWLRAPNPPCSQGTGQSSCSSTHQAQHPSSASPPPPLGPGVPRERCGLPRLSSSPYAKLTELSREPGAVSSWRIVLAGLLMAPHRTDHQRCHHSVCCRGGMWSLLGVGCAGTQHESQEIQTLGIMEQSVCCFANIP